MAREKKLLTKMFSEKGLQNDQLKVAHAKKG